MINTLTGIYGWWRAGDAGQYCTLGMKHNDQIITELRDSTTNQHHLDGQQDQYEPGYRVGVTLDVRHGGPWSTTRPLIGIDNAPDGTKWYGNVYYPRQIIQLAGKFALMGVMTNSRPGGLRDIFCSPGRACKSEGLRIEQGPDSKLWLRINGAKKLISSTVARGPIIMEVTRDAADLIKVRINGSDVTSPGLPAMPGNLVIDRIGWDGNGGNSHFDDYLCELAICSDVPASGEMLAARQYWSGVWGIGITLS